MELKRLKSNTEHKDMADVLRAEGAVIIEDFVDASVAEQVLADLRPKFDSEDGLSTQSDFNGYDTLRINSVLDFSRASAEIVGHQRMLEVIDEILQPFCMSFQIGSCTAIEVLPGEADQVLHRDDSIYPIHLPGTELQVSVMWALDEFTIENGATRVVLDSHRWVKPRAPRETDQVVQAPMSRGSALFYLGSMWHGGGANRTSKSRAGLINTYSLGWLRPEVNHMVMIPRDVALSYPLYLQRLIGYNSHDGHLGWYQHPDLPSVTNG